MCFIGFEGGRRGGFGICLLLIGRFFWAFIRGFWVYVSIDVYIRGGI